MPKPVKKKRKRKKPSLEPLWKGPYEDGITQSLLGLFITCRERFRLKTVYGWREKEDVWDHKLGYGNMWHLCEEMHAQAFDWKSTLEQYTVALRAQYPGCWENISKHYSLCKRQFPIYLKHWEAHPDVLQRENIYPEVSFQVPVTLPSGRDILLRGKWDSVDIIGDKRPEIFIQENKCKGVINEEKISSQLAEDLQCMVYSVAWTWSQEACDYSHPFGGVRYNVVRRPLGDFHAKKQRKGKLVNKKSPDGKVVKDAEGNNVKVRDGAETTSQFYDRIAEEISNDPDHYFKRWKVRLTESELEKCSNEVLFPWLEQLCDWWEWIAVEPENPWRKDAQGVPGGGFHYRNPFGVYSPLHGAPGRDKYEDMVLTGSSQSLEKVTNLYPELD